MSHSSRLIYEGRVIKLGIESLTLPNGMAVELEVVRHPGGAAVVAIDNDNRICMLRQYRHAAGGWLWELPAGKLEPEETPATTASRELAEEAGLHAGSWTELGKILVTPGFCDEAIYLFLATDLVGTRTQQEPDELIEVHWMPFNEALEQVYNGTILDAKTMLGLLLTYRHINRKTR
ncbi:MAG: NUDIX hydrolase [Gammaproteobacteria bacterium]